MQLCADDFGLNPGVSSGILELLAMNRLSAVGCMVNMSDFKVSAPALAQQDNIQKGLHFNLTEGIYLSQKNLSAMGLNELLIKTHTKTFNREFVKQELNAQLNCYQDIMGEEPQFIDGHQHVHQFPIIRETLLEVYTQRFKNQHVTIRSTYPAITCIPFKTKATILAWTGGFALQKLLKKYHIPHNSFFAGIYDFKKDRDYRSLFKFWLQNATQDTLIMCHPGKAWQGSDPIAHARLAEMNYFASDDFLGDLQAHSLDKVKV